MSMLVIVQGSLPDPPATVVHNLCRDSFVRWRPVPPLASYKCDSEDTEALLLPQPFRTVAMVEVEGLVRFVLRDAVPKHTA